MGKGWSDKYKKSIDCDNPKGFSQRAHCQGKKKMNEEGLRDWFGKSKSKDGKSGWVNVVTGGTCASDEPGEGTPKCVSSAKRASMTKAERLSAQRRKKKADPGQQQKTGAAKPTYVKTDSPRKMKKEEVEVTEAKDKKGKGSGTKDACYHKVKSRIAYGPLPMHLVLWLSVVRLVLPTGVIVQKKRDSLPHKLPLSNLQALLNSMKRVKSAGRVMRRKEPK